MQPIKRARTLDAYFFNRRRLIRYGSDRPFMKDYARMVLLQGTTCDTVPDNHVKEFVDTLLRYSTYSVTKGRANACDEKTARANLRSHLPATYALFSCDGIHYVLNPTQTMAMTSKERYKYKKYRMTFLLSTHYHADVPVKELYRLAHSYDFSGRKVCSVLTEIISRRINDGAPPARWKRAVENTLIQEDGGALTDDLYDIKLCYIHIPLEVMMHIMRYAIHDIHFLNGAGLVDVHWYRIVLASCNTIVVDGKSFENVPIPAIAGARRIVIRRMPAMDDTKNLIKYMHPDVLDFSQYINASGVSKQTKKSFLSFVHWIAEQRKAQAADPAAASRDCLDRCFTFIMPKWLNPTVSRYGRRYVQGAWWAKFSPKCDPIMSCFCDIVPKLLPNLREIGNLPLDRELDALSKLLPLLRRVSIQPSRIVSVPLVLHVPTVIHTLAIHAPLWNTGEERMLLTFPCDNAQMWRALTVPRTFFDPASLWRKGHFTQLKHLTICNPAAPSRPTVPDDNCVVADYVYGPHFVNVAPQLEHITMMYDNGCHDERVANPYGSNYPNNVADAFKYTGRNLREIEIVANIVHEDVLIISRNIRYRKRIGLIVARTTIESELADYRPNDRWDHGKMYRYACCHFTTRTFDWFKRLVIRTNTRTLDEIRVVACRTHWIVPKQAKPQNPVLRKQYLRRNYTPLVEHYLELKELHESMRPVYSGCTASTAPTNIIVIDP